jgi:hypothetical protein
MKMEQMPLTIADAQRDMRYGYAGGAPGMFASAMAWCTAGVVALNGTPKQAVVALFIGGMLIHPVGVLLTKLLRRPGAHAKGNPFAALAMESTIMMIMCFPLAYGASLVRSEWFFPAMMMIIGGRFLLFATMYGMKIYWVCGAALGVAGWLLYKSGAPLATGAFTGMTIEATFSLVIYTMVRKDAKPN